MNERQGPVGGLSEHELSEIRMLIEERTGICFDESRERFFSTRVLEHLRAKKFASGTELLRAMHKANVEYEALLERLLTQETSFFRYPAVYETFEKRVLPELHVKKFWKNPRTLRVWSAGCSTGEEPYSIAITITDALSFADAWNVEILATDVGRQALKQAERGIYSGRCIASVTPAQLATHFTAVDLRADESRRRGLRRAYGRDLLHECVDLFLGRAPPRAGAAFLRHARARRLLVSRPLRIDFKDAS
jgi:chemotaxis protein methyltransferase CheR